MLRASADRFGYDLDERVIADPSLPVGIPGGTELLRLVDAVLLDREAATARADVVEALDEASLVDAAAVLGNFEMMNRVAEASGIPVSQQAVDRNAGLVEALGIGGFRE